MIKSLRCVSVQRTHLQNPREVEQPPGFRQEDEIDKAGEPEAHWRGHVDAWPASGNSQKAYCEQRGLRSHSLSYWRLRLAKGPGPCGARGPLTLVPAAMIS